jgi:NDP-sugar pyrophosphorylase family protein
MAAEQFFLNSKSNALMTVYKNRNQFDSSNVEFIDGVLINYKKGSNSRKMHYIDYGITFFRDTSFRPWRNLTSFDLSEVCHQLATRGDLLGYEVFERFYEIGSLQGIEEFSQYLKEASNEL